MNKIHVPQTDKVFLALSRLNSLYGNGSVVSYYSNTNIATIKLPRGYQQKSFRVVGNTVHFCGHQQAIRK